jgi:hypothetical protein
MFQQQPHQQEESSRLTTRGRSIKFTPERIQQIKNLVERGKSREEIADILGVTIGSLQVTCSKMGISLRRARIMNGVCLAKRREPLQENTPLPHRAGDQDRQLSSEPTEEKSEGSSPALSAGPDVIARPQEEQATKPDAYSASFAIIFSNNRGMERTAELALTPQTVDQLALEAVLRDMKIGDLMAELITEILNKDLFPLLLDNIDHARSRSKGT